MCMSAIMACLDHWCWVGKACRLNDDGIKLVAPLEQLVDRPDQISTHCIARQHIRGVQPGVAAGTTRQAYMDGFSQL